MESKQEKASKEKRLIEQLSFYGAYHSNPYNQLIHVIFVPAIWWASVIVLRALLEKFVSESFGYWSVVAIYLFYVGYYLSLGDYPVSASYSVILTMMFVHATRFYDEHSSAWFWALIVKGFSWWVQIAIGHNKLEGRKPALLDSLFDAVVMAPLFTWYEILFYCGFRAPFKRQLDNAVAQRILELNRARKIPAANPKAASTADK